jgi:hypothetical protein
VAGPLHLGQALVAHHPSEVVQDEGRLHSSQPVPLSSSVVYHASSSDVPAVSSSSATGHLVVEVVAVAVEAVGVDMSAFVVQLAVPEVNVVGVCVQEAMNRFEEGFRAVERSLRRYRKIRKAMTNFFAG